MPATVLQFGKRIGSATLLRDARHRLYVPLAEIPSDFVVHCRQYLREHGQLPPPPHHYRWMFMKFRIERAYAAALRGPVSNEIEDILLGKI